ncbi:lipid-A-disaccharide synthase [Sediminicoccus sp. KRV36]|uniref:lipid-A-disaccharide synthase n=1 Tax=Sediminicoccus sp. KRV36 TaxID=3133721 RepID=UPI00200CBC42|nr:lipid-A-disaccharide synthase [Sediminicoccus rosea]UPY35299.1 lipid-A-disaccharide synthase [Sediminicoccus rosea]
MLRMMLYLAAGEASGDILGARLIAALRARDSSLEFAGIGGERMAEQGFASLFDIRQLALMGVAEVLPSLFRLKQRMEEAVADITARRPRLIITIDSPGFTLRLAARVKHLGIPVIHYVAPQVWAWRPGRVKKIAQCVDRILALLPFEAPIFEAAGIPVDFVGHPILESEAAHGVAEHAPGDGRRLIIMPGSRRGEVSRLLPIFAETLKRLPGDLHPIIGLAGTVEEMVRARTAEWGRPVSLVRSPQDKADAFAAARAGLIKSGTSSLEAAVAGLPHVIGYTFNPISNAIIRQLHLVKYASLVNLLLDEPLVPEFLLHQCRPEGLAAALRRLIEDDEAVARQREGFTRALARLHPEHGLPSEAAADAVLRQL